MPMSARTIDRVVATTVNFKLSGIYFSTQEEAEARVKSVFPKGARVRVHRVTYHDGSGWVDGFTYGTDIKLSADEVNGGRNESGIKRARQIINALGEDFEYFDGYTNSLTREELEVL